MSERPKVFGVGFQKTGTSSLAGALRILGYDTIGGVKDPDIATRAVEIATRLSAQHDAFQDGLWPMVYREMDARHPAARFVLTIRPVDDWLDSMLAAFAGKSSALREWVYGEADPAGHEDRYVEAY